MTMQLFCLLNSIPKPWDEYRFAAIATGGTGNGLRARLKAANLCDWRFDYAWPAYKIALEIEGGLWLRRSKSRHFSGRGVIGDMRKYNEAAIMGWLIIRRTPDDATNAECADLIKRAIASRLDSNATPIYKPET
jgi:hypothetical protein